MKIEKTIFKIILVVTILNVIISALLENYTTTLAWAVNVCWLVVILKLINDNEKLKQEKR